MVKIRRGNSFYIVWEIKRKYNYDINLVDAINKKLYVNYFRSKTEITVYEIIDNNTIRVRFTPETTTGLGVYNLEIEYEYLGEKFAFDADCFEIVSSTKLEVNYQESEYMVTSNIMTGLKGDPGENPYIKDGYWWVGDVNQGIKATFTALSAEEKRSVADELINSGYIAKINIVDELPEVGNPGEFYATLLE